MAEIPAAKMSVRQITDEIDALDAQFSELQRSCDGMAGSPGEWMIERLNELETELNRRRAPNSALTSGQGK